MTIFIDENFPAQLVRGIHMLEAGNDEGVEVVSIKDRFGAGANDEEWIVELGRIGATVITQDHNIHRKKLQQELYTINKVGLIIFKARGKTGYTYWQMVENIIKHWVAIKNQIKISKPPIAYVITPRTSKLIRL